MSPTPSTVRVILAVLVATSAIAPTFLSRARAEGIANDPSRSSVSQPLVLAVLMDRDRRGSPYSNSQTHVGATGLVRCGNTVGTAQLVLRQDIIVTAAHVLFGSSGGHRDCMFLPRMGLGQPVAIETATIKAGSHAPLSEAATRDWAVARLAAPITAATPYVLAAQGAQPGTVTLCAAGSGGPTQFGAETCAVRRVIKTAADGIRELAIDCSGNPGGSGAALLSQNGAVAGIYVGDRSTNPSAAQPFSDTHYNFGITIDGAFRRALLSEAAATR
jgi:hypothetical protein